MAVHRNFYTAASSQYISRVEPSALPLTCSGTLCPCNVPLTLHRRTCQVAPNRNHKPCDISKCRFGDITIQVGIHMHVCMYIHIRIYIYKYTHILYTYIYICSRPLRHAEMHFLCPDIRRATDPEIPKIQKSKNPNVQTLLQDSVDVKSFGFLDFRFLDFWNFGFLNVCILDP